MHIRNLLAGLTIACLPLMALAGPLAAYEALEKTEPRWVAGYQLPDSLHYHQGHTWARLEDRGLVTVGLTGATGGRMRELCDHCLNMPSSDTPRIQECHITVGHILCANTESVLFGQ